MDLTEIISNINEVSAGFGGNQVTIDDWNSAVRACVVPPATQAKYEEQRKQIDNSNASEVKNEVAQATRISDDSTNGFTLIKTSSGAVLPDIKDNTNELTREQLKSGFCCIKNNIKEDTSKPISPEDIIFQKVDNGVQASTEALVGEVKEEHKAITQMKNARAAYKDEKVISAKEEALVNDKKCNKQANDETLYYKDKFSTKEGDITITTILKQADWDGYFCGDVEKDLDSLKSLVSRFISKNYGGFKNIRRIVVRDYRLIINNSSCIIPKLSKSCYKCLPVDSHNYIKNGALAQCFDWHYLVKMENLGVLDFDSGDFLHDWVLPDLGWGGASGTNIYKALFYNIKCLREVTIMGETVTREDFENMLKQEKETGEVKGFSILDSLSRKARMKKIYRDTVSQDNEGFFTKLFAGKSPDLITPMDTLREWQWSTVKNYATNRGSKGFIRYSIGTVSRVAFALAVTPLTWAPRIVKGVSTMVRDIFKEATTPITDEEVGIDGVTTPVTDEEVDID